LTRAELLQDDPSAARWPDLQPDKLTGDHFRDLLLLGLEKKERAASAIGSAIEARKTRPERQTRRETKALVLIFHPPALLRHSL
jgi:hypothetical protein